MWSSSSVYLWLDAAWTIPLRSCRVSLVLSCVRVEPPTRSPAMVWTWSGAGWLFWKLPQQWGCQRARRQAPSSPPMAPDVALMATSAMGVSPVVRNSLSMAIRKTTPEGQGTVGSTRTYNNRWTVFIDVKDNGFERDILNKWNLEVKFRNESWFLYKWLCTLFLKWFTVK